MDGRAQPEVVAPRSAGGRAAGSPATSRADMAWEFLRRDPAYQSAWRRVTGRAHDPGRWTQGEPNWGLVFPVDPHLGAASAGVFWSGDAAPAVVVEVEPCLTVCGRSLDLSALPWSQRGEGAVTHMRAPGGLQVRILTRDLHQPLAAVAPLGVDFEIRLRTLARLHRALRDRPPGAEFTAQQLRRLQLALQAIDGRSGGLSQREIATDLFGRAAMAREPWKCSSLRETTQRLVRLGERLRRGGYRSLLLTRPR